MAAPVMVSLAAWGVSPLLPSLPPTLFTYRTMGAVVDCRFCPSTVLGTGGSMANPMCGRASGEPPAAAPALEALYLLPDVTVHGQDEVVGMQGCLEDRLHVALLHRHIVGVEEGGQRGVGERGVPQLTWEGRVVEMGIWRL